MSLPRYPEYKASEVGWLGEVPVHWNIRRLGYFFSERREKVSDKEFQPLSVTKNGVVPQLETAAKTDDGDNRKLVRAGDFVINSRSDRKGSSGASTLDGSVSLINTVLAPTDDISVHFAHHLLRSVPFQEEYYRFGKGIVADLWSTNYSEMRNIALAVPKYEEQQGIAKFLDRETAKIDVLIAEQQTLLALLAEKRQATISRAVTSGLDPGVPMKDSGIAWLGEVPAHWKVVPIKRLIAQGTSISYGIVQPGEPQEDGVPFLQTTNMTDGDFSAEKLQKTTQVIAAQYPRSRLTGGEVLLGIRASIGAAHVAPSWLAGANLSRGIARIQTGSRILPEYLVLFLGTSQVSEYWQLSKQGSTFNEVSIETVRELAISVPTVDEQRAIIAHVDAQSRNFDELLGAAEVAINLLRERRSALIAAAVTGKIDVRATK